MSTAQASLDFQAPSLHIATTDCIQLSELFSFKSHKPLTQVKQY